MNRPIWIVHLAAALVLSAAPAISAPAVSRTAQSSASSKAKKKRKNSTSRKKSKQTVHGQTAPTPDRVREIQAALQQKGALAAEPNGKWDDATVEAMKKFQSANNLTPTGKIDALTLNQLGLGAETAGRGAPVTGASSGSSAPPL